MFQDLLFLIKEAFKSTNKRIYILGVIFVTLFVVISVRLFNLQIINGNYFENNYVQKSIKHVTIPAARGIIYDKDGKILAYNELIKNVTLADIDAYPQNRKGINDRNTMLLKLTKLLNKYDCKIDSKYLVTIDENDKFVFLPSSERQLKTFIANVYGRNVSDLDEGSKFKYRSDITAKEAFEISKKRYAMDIMVDEFNNPMIIDDKTMLSMIGIHYTMRLTSYQKYNPTVIAQNISSRCAAEILETKGELKGVEIEETSSRKYNYSVYFAHIIGYIGNTSDIRINELRQIDPQYDINDKVGLLGIEKSMENVLKGKKGSKKIIVDSSGKILETLENIEPISGNDVYLTISVNDQIANYHLLEQRLAGIVADKIVNDTTDNQKRDSSSMRIPVYEAYYHLIENNILNREHFEKEDALYAEKQIYKIFLEQKERVKGEIYRNLVNEDSLIQGNLSNEMQNYLAYIYTYLFTHNNILMSDSINRDVNEYILWKEDKISLRNFLLKAIEEMWIDTSKIFSENKYGNRDYVYEALVKYIMGILEDNKEFDNLIFKFQLKSKVISNRLICMALFEQNVLEFNEVEYEKISKGDDNYVHTFFIRLIRDLRLTPEMLALDPCTGSICVSDVNTGKIKSLVTYPSFDNNLIYIKKYLDYYNTNNAMPLVNCSTQTNLAPGSSFKPITALASLEEHIITANDIIVCDGIFDEIDPPIRCWAFPYNHDKLNLIGGLKNSCNVFFSTVGHMLSIDENKNYSTDTGLKKLIKYAEYFGLNQKSGIEIDELEPKISNQDPERSAMGQGTHAFNNVQLAKYTIALANGGNLYDLSLLLKVCNKNGDVIMEFPKKKVAELPISESNFKTVKDGLRAVINDGVARVAFWHQDVEICGKTGTAQERNDRPNHATFISFAPYSKPEIAVNVVIPFGYSSGNAAALANAVYNYQYGKTDFETIISQNADGITNINVSD